MAQLSLLESKMASRSSTRPAKIEVAVRKRKVDDVVDDNSDENFGQVIPGPVKTLMFVATFFLQMDHPVWRHVPNDEIYEQFKDCFGSMLENESIKKKVEWLHASLEMNPRPHIHMVMRMTHRMMREGVRKVCEKMATLFAAKVSYVASMSGSVADAVRYADKDQASLGHSPVVYNPNNLDAMNGFKTDQAKEAAQKMLEASLQQSAFKNLVGYILQGHTYLQSMNCGQFSLEFIMQNYSKAKSVANHLKIDACREVTKLKTAKLYRWQHQVLKMLDQQNERQVLFLVDRKGNAGKSFLARHLETHHDAFVTQSISIQHVGYAYNMQSVVVVDLTRQDLNGVSTNVYKTVELFKNGHFFSQKYESQVKTFPPPKVVVMMNQMPDKKAMSMDRFVVYEVPDRAKDKEMFRMAEDNYAFDFTNKAVNAKVKALFEKFKKAAVQRDDFQDGDFIDDDQQDDSPPSKKRKKVGWLYVCMYTLSLNFFFYLYLMLTINTFCVLYVSGFTQDYNQHSL